MAPACLLGVCSLLCAWAVVTGHPCSLDHQVPTALQPSQLPACPYNGQSSPAPLPQLGGCPCVTEELPRGLEVGIQGRKRKALCKLTLYDNCPGWADCNGKSLQHAPSSLPRNITSLDLSFNSLVVPRDRTLLMHFPSLRSLNLSSNAMPSLSPAIFSNLGALRLLDLSSCGITSLHTDTFQGLGNLHTLLLRNNSLQELDVSFLLPLKALFHLDLQHNELVSVDTWSLQLMETVPQVRLEGNPWVCDCTVQPLQQWLQHRKAVQVTCVSPPGLRGQEISALDSRDLGCRTKHRFPRALSTAQQTTVTQSNTTNTTLPATVKGGRSWPYLVAFLVTAVGVSILIAVAAKCKLVHKNFASYRHRPLPEISSIGGSPMEDCSGWDRASCGSQSMQADLQAEDDDGFIEDNYIQPSEQLPDKQERDLRLSV